MFVLVCCRKVIVVEAITVKVLGEVMCKLWFVWYGVCSGCSNTVVIILPSTVVVVVVYAF